MQESAGDLVGEEWGDDRLLLSIKEGGHPNPGAECCVHALYCRWSSYVTGDWSHKRRRRSGDGVPAGRGLVDAGDGP